MMSSDNNTLQMTLAEMLVEQQKRIVPTAEATAAMLEKGGWKREIASETDFNAAVNAIRRSHEYKGLGIIISGKYGCGKTALMNAYLPNLCKPDQVFRINLGDMDDLIKLDRSWQADNCVDPTKMHVYLDDLGSEPIKSEYGSFSEIVTDFVVWWHLHKLPNCRLYFTTNLNSEEIDIKYGGRFFSRVKELCTPLHLTGRDKRKWKL